MEDHNTRDMGAVMYATLLRCAPQGLDYALSRTLVDEFLRVMHTFDGVPQFDLPSVAFIKVPPLALNKPRTLPALLKRHGITDARDIDDIRATMEGLVAYNRAEGRGAPPYYPFVWYPPEREHSIMVTPMDHVVGGKIYALATLLPLQQDDELQQAYYGMLVGYLFAQVKYTTNSTVHYAFHIQSGAEAQKVIFLMSVER